MWMGSSQHWFKACFPHLRPPKQASTTGMSLATGKPAKAAQRTVGGWGKKGRKREKKKISCEDAERTNVAHLTEDMNGGCLITAQKVQNQRDKSR